MKLKFKILIILCILLITLGIFSYNEINQKDSIVIGDTTFRLIDNYHKIVSDGTKSADISNGTNTLHIYVCKDDNITKYIEEYENEKTNLNISLISSNFTIGNMTIFTKSMENNESVMHYWFVNKNKTYSISTWDGTKNTNETICNLIRYSDFPN